MRTLIAFALFLTFSLESKEIDFDSEQYFLANLAPKLKLSSKLNVINVSNSEQLYQSIENATSPLVVLLKPGEYAIYRTLLVNTDDIYLIGAGESPFDVKLTGNGMIERDGVDNLIRVTGNRFTIANMTLQEAGNHLIQFASERGASQPFVQNVVFQDSYEQLLKVSFDQNRLDAFSSGGVIKNCLFRYRTGVGPNWYVGGIDAHGIQYWTIESNVFDSIASPSKHISEHAIHLWNASKNNVVKNNIIINSDRGVGFGMRNGSLFKLGFSNLGGEISSNIFYHSDNDHPYSDVAIILEDSPDTIIKNNLILSEHDYVNAIEVRFKTTNGVIVLKNYSNKKMIERNGGRAVFIGNEELLNKKLAGIILNKLNK